MFAYEERDSFLCRLTPLSKLAVILLLTVIISTSLSAWLPLFTLVLTFFAALIGGRMSVPYLLRRIKLLLGVVFSFMVFMFLFRGIGTEDPDVTFWFLGWTEQNFLNILALGLRIGSFAFMSVIFVLTTSPNDLVLSLIQQLHVSPVHGYAALAAYRFVPTIAQETRTVRMAQEIRGAEWEGSLWKRLKGPFLLFMPLLCTAARRGERIAAAMENRGLGKTAERCYYKHVSFKKRDWIFMGTVAVLYIALILLLIRLDVYRFSFGFWFN